MDLYSFMWFHYVCMLGDINQAIIPHSIIQFIEDKKTFRNYSHKTFARITRAQTHVLQCSGSGIRQPSVFHRLEYGRWIWHQQAPPKVFCHNDIIRMVHSVFFLFLLFWLLLKLFSIMTHAFDSPSLAQEVKETLPSGDTDSNKNLKKVPTFP